MFCVLAISAFALITCMINLKFMNRLQKLFCEKNDNNLDDLVSILIPARNEANNIR